MESKRESVLVGLFTLVAAALLVVVVLLLSGTFGKGTVPYRAYFKNAGGLAPGSEVRYAGGPPIGRVEKVISDPDEFHADGDRFCSGSQRPCEDRQHRGNHQQQPAGR